MMSIGWVSDSGSLLHSPTVPCSVWYGYAFASPFSYVPAACGVSSTSARTSAPEAARSRAVPAGSGLPALTFSLATVRKPPGRDLSLSSSPKRFSHTTAGSSSAASAEAERRRSAPASSTGMIRPSHGRKVSARLPRFHRQSGISACSSMTRARSRASAASTSPRFHGSGREPIRIARRMPARQVPRRTSQRLAPSCLVSGVSTCVIVISSFIRRSESELLLFGARLACLTAGGVFPAGGRLRTRAVQRGSRSARPRPAGLAERRRVLLVPARSAWPLRRAFRVIARAGLRVLSGFVAAGLLCALASKGPAQCHHKLAACLQRVGQHGRHRAGLAERGSEDESVVSPRL